jgi:hypothetical protein
MRISKTTPKSLFTLATAALLSFGFANLVLYPSSAQAEHHDYEWSATLISYDEASRTAVVQARIESYVSIEGLDEFSDGDRLILIWTGRNWAAGIRGLAADPELTPETLSLPVEFVSTERDEQYVNFRIPVPDSAVDTIASMEPGTRVTGMSPRMATDWDTSVSSLRDYNNIS